jgi:hypothetical protein
MVAIRQEAQHRGVIDGSDPPEPAVPHRHHGGGACIVGVGLDGARRVEQPHPRRQARRHVKDGLTGSDELLGQQSTQPTGAFDRPGARLEPGGKGQQPIALVPVSDQPELVDHGLGPVENRGGVGALVRVDPDGEHMASSASSSSAGAAAGQS